MVKRDIGISLMHFTNVYNEKILARKCHTVFKVRTIFKKKSFVARFLLNGLLYYYYSANCATGVTKILITYPNFNLRPVGHKSADFIVIQFEFYPGLGGPCTVDLIKIATVFISITNPITKASLVWLNLVLLSYNLQVVFRNHEYDVQIWHKKIADLKLLCHVTAILSLDIYYSLKSLFLKRTRQF